MKQKRLSPLEFFEREVLPRLSVEAVYSGAEFANRQGRYWRAPCPLHKGEDPNFSVDTLTLGWTCWSQCGSGSVLGFLNGGDTPRGIQFIERVKEAAAIAGVDTSPIEMDFSPEDEEKLRKRDLLEAFQGLTREALRYREESTLKDHIYQEVLDKRDARVIEAEQRSKKRELADRARKYLELRGFGNPDDLPLGLCPPLEEVKAKLISRGFTEIELDALLRDLRWEGRLVIPWRDRWGQLATFVARDLTHEAKEKYLYLSGAKKPDFFGLDVALRTPEGKTNLVLVEGLLDVVALQAQGFLNMAAIGGSGQSLTPARWERLSSLGVETVTLVLDNDPAGIMGLLAAIKNTTKTRNTPNVYVVHPPLLGDYKDPDEFVREKGCDEFSSLLMDAPSAPMYQAQYFTLKDVTPTSPERIRAEAVFPTLLLANSLHGPRADLECEGVLRLLSERTGYSIEALEMQAAFHENRRMIEEQERGLEEAIRRAQRARAEGQLVDHVCTSLATDLAGLRSWVEKSPPFFSVDRLLRESRELPEGKPSGWAALDNLDVRFHSGELSLLAARTGHGKTSVLVNLLRNWLKATERTEQVLVLYSAEEPEARIFHRLLSLVSTESGGGWKANEVRDYLRDVNSRPSWPGKNLDAEQERLRAWENRLLVVHRSGWTVADMDAHARRIASSRSLGAVLVDYLQRIPAPSRESRRDIEVSAVARHLKSLAVDLSCPVVAAAQIDREAVPDRYRENLSGKDYRSARSTIQKARPALHHLREGGSEQEADLVLGLLNCRADLEETEGNRAPDVTRFELGTLKARYGTPGRWATLAFEGRFGLLRDLDPREEL